ncbi:MAG: SLC13 family permease [Planctomycetales bacterium]|nr:SLC13 family permease [Planctomycetales bacterium]
MIVPRTAAELLLGVPTLTTEGIIALATTTAVFLAMQLRRRVPIEVLFLGGLVIVTLCGVVTPQRAIAGFASNAVILIGALFAVSAGLRNTGALDWVGQRLLGRAETERGALLRLGLTIPPVSAFVLNTPLVAMMAPVVVDWCRRRNVSPSRLMIPLSYLTILGGVCTLIGTSTTLVVNGSLGELHKTPEKFPLIDAARIAELTMFEITVVGVPVALVGIAYMMFVAPKLLPDRDDLIERFDEHRRDYLVDMTVLPTCPLAGRTVHDAGLRQLPGLFLIEIDRNGETITPVAPGDRIHAGDHLVFTGVVSTIADLERIPGLVPAADKNFEHLPADRVHRQLTEAVLSRTSPLVGLTVKEADFRQRYNAAIVAIHRNGERVTNKIGDVELEPGDTLLLQTRPEFVDAHRNSRDFYLVSRVGGATARRHDRALLAGLLFLGLILWLAISSFFPGAIPWGYVMSKDVKAIAAIAIVLAMIVTRCMTTSEARSAIDIQVLLVIGAAIGLGEALDKSGAARWLAEMLVRGASTAGFAPAWRPFILLAVVYVLTQLLTEAISNVAVASIMIPIAVHVAAAGGAAGYDPRPFIVAVTLAASLSFATPIGYQTNLMVMGPGGYSPRDYWKAGLPLAALTTVTALMAITWAFPFAR